IAATERREAKWHDLHCRRVGYGNHHVVHAGRSRPERQLYGEYTSVHCAQARQRPPILRSAEIVASKSFSMIITSPTRSPDFAERQAAQSGCCSDSSFTNMLMACPRGAAELAPLHCDRAFSFDAWRIFWTKSEL